MGSRQEKKAVPSMPSLKTRLEQAQKSSPTEEQRKDHLIRQTDLLRGKAIPWMVEQEFSSRSLLTYIHNVHVLGNEGLVLFPETITEIIKRGTGQEIAGQVRPNGGKDPADPSTRIFMEGLNCGTRSVAYTLLNELLAKVDNLFPVDGVSKTVTKDTVYTYLASIQYLLLLTHPFLEANGRTSEDFIYALMLRYDKTHPEESSIVRNVSFDGSRTGVGTDTVMLIMDVASLGISNRIIKDTFKPDIHLYDDLPIFWAFQTLISYVIRQFSVNNNRIPTEQEFEEITKSIQATYDIAYLEYVQKLIFVFLSSETIASDVANDPKIQQNAVVIQGLTQNLINASPDYHFS